MHGETAHRNDRGYDAGGPKSSAGRACLEPWVNDSMPDEGAGNDMTSHSEECRNSREYHHFGGVALPADPLSRREAIGRPREVTRAGLQLSIVI